MLADGQVGITGRQDSPVDGGALRDLRAEQSPVSHGAGVVPGGGRQPGVEADGRGTGRGPRGVDRTQEAVGIGDSTRRPTWPAPHLSGPHLSAVRLPVPRRHDVPGAGHGRPAGSGASSANGYGTPPGSGRGNRPRIRGRHGPATR